MPDERTSYRVCSLCEATCGLEIRTRGREVVSIRGDEADVFSQGFICPKAYALKELDADPDRLRTPLVRRNGALEPATGDEAFAEIGRRGGTVVVIDPRRTRTATEASEHHFIRPGTDAYFLFGIVHALFAEGLVRLGRLAEHTAGVEEVEALARPFAPEAVAGRCGIDAATIRRLARELARAERAAVYARIGTCTQEFGTLSSWLADVINALPGHLDQPGGAMFTRPATGRPPPPSPP